MDDALARVLPDALVLAPQITKFTTWEQAQFAKPYPYAGAVAIAKAYTLFYYGREAEAQKTIELIEQKLPFAMLLRTNRTLLWARQQLRYHQHACAVYFAMTEHRLDTFKFPAERDKFDVDSLLSRLDRRDTDEIILAVAKKWRASFEMRNYLGLLAVELGSRDIAAEVMKDMGDNWSKQFWRGKDDIIESLLPARPAPRRIADDACALGLTQ